MAYHGVRKTFVWLVFALLMAVPVPALARDQTGAQAGTNTSGQDGAQKNKEKRKDKDQKDDTGKKTKNSDIENIGTRDINKGSINFYSIEKEIATGRQLAAEIERQVKLLNDPPINEYVNRLGQNIVRNSDAQVPFTIKVVESEEINAFALPGGFFYVNSGLILTADEEAELAGVMAHEIAHVAARHGTKQASKGELVNFASIPLIFMGGIGGLALRQAANLLIPMQFLQFSRKDEAEADYLGLQYMYKAGYDPASTVTFFEKLQAREHAKPGSVSKLFSTHPPTGDRIEMNKKNMEILPARDQYVVTTSEFNQVKAQLAQLENRKRSEEANRPSLRRRTQRPDPSSTTTNDDGSDRPTLKRKPSGQSSDSNSGKTETKSSDSGATKPEGQETSDEAGRN